MFANDTCLVYVDSDLNTLVSRVNERLSRVYDWCVHNKLSLNLSKCNYMLVTPKKITEDPVIVLGGERILRARSVKYLGVYLDDSLKFQDQINHLSKKMSQICGVSYRLGHHLDLGSAYNFYYSCVYSTLTYCVCVWGGVLQCTARANLLQRLQSKIVKNIFGSYASTDGCLFKNTEILKVADIHRFCIGVYMYKIVKMNINPTLQVNLDLKFPSHEHGTRNFNDLILPFPRIESIRINYKYQCTKIWNCIPVLIKEQPNLKMFKKFFKKHMLEMY